VYAPITRLLLCKHDAKEQKQASEQIKPFIHRHFTRILKFQSLAKGQTNAHRNVIITPHFNNIVVIAKGQL
jgi:hypothetical protein